MEFSLRDYRPEDEASWLRCRVLSFLGTPYYDNVLPAKPAMAAPGCSLVAADADVNADVDADAGGQGSAGVVVGCLDLAVDGELATIETIAVHPDHQRRGIGRALLAEAAVRARAAGATTLDAWTRDQPESLAWYRATGFVESDHYLHVFADAYADEGEPGRAVERPGAGLNPIGVFSHAPLAREEEMRTRFRRVYVCRRFSQPLTPAG
ncbi:GNAT family N-acetyltransferase [Streptomyces sp. 3MP-14]|uniref:GNAT family N-acetyltransferase n=1 Tax=Streptomyces mimosae TaxID=2586635 RepID=A0A5N6AGB9_9ACTN|nr:MULTISPECIES: GNAT family N-acetyltransferase [Streptomyces]KAB8167764.1 GNAT family N-acetyltransferase [Streptomyces mimosae]KAB8177588.1 GNAT family N-acetyltransferase [Streptomyces sp. 3MP-14]